MDLKLSKFLTVADGKMGSNIFIVCDAKETGSDGGWWENMVSILRNISINNATGMR